MPDRGDYLTIVLQRMTPHRNVFLFISFSMCFKVNKIICHNAHKKNNTLSIRTTLTIITITAQLLSAFKDKSLSAIKMQLMLHAGS